MRHVNEAIYFILCDMRWRLSFSERWRSSFLFWMPILLCANAATLLLLGNLYYYFFFTLDFECINRMGLVNASFVVNHVWLIIKICLFENTKRKLKLICMRVLTTNVQSTMHRHMLLANACRQNHINFFCPHNVKKNCKSIALINENTWLNGKFIKQ